MEELKRLEAGPLYEYVCKQLRWTVDSSMLSGFKDKNKETLATLDAAISDAKENLGESEVTIFFSSHHLIIVNKLTQT